MNLTSIPDGELIERTDSIVKREREVLAEVLQHLREIERRRLFSTLGFRSLFDYATKRLGYAEDQAARRISAMRLLRDLPELEPDVRQGSLTLTNMAMAQTLFRHAMVGDFSKDRRLELLQDLRNKSKREAEHIIAARSSSPAGLKPDRIRPVTQETISISFVAGHELEEKIAKVRGLLAHSHPQASLADLMSYLCDLAIEKLDPSKKKCREAPKVMRQLPTLPAPVSERRITARARRTVWQQAKSKCQTCGSVHALQVDHVLPKSLGGSDEAENLRLLCRSCNQRAAIEKLGLPKMRRFLDRPMGG
ncbi:MAG: HNH endonuclease [Bdellovibrionales bacterium]